jgi:hypothetical protein
MYAEIVSAIESAKTLRELLKAASSLSNYNELVAAVSEVSARLMDATAVALASQEKQSELAQQVASFRRRSASSQTGTLWLRATHSKKLPPASSRTCMRRPLGLSSRSTGRARSVSKTASCLCCSANIRPRTCAIAAAPRSRRTRTVLSSPSRRCTEWLRLTARALTAPSSGRFERLRQPEAAAQRQRYASIWYAYAATPEGRCSCASASRGPCA